MRIAFLVGLGVALTTSSAGAVDYAVGPGQTYTDILDVPLDMLGPGDVVSIHWRSDPYRERFGVDTAGADGMPIVIRGVPGDNGELPVLDAESAVDGYGAHDRGIIHVSGGAQYVVVENLELRNANEASGLLDNSAGIFAPGGAHLIFRNLDIHHNGNGFFSWVDASDVLVEGCTIHDNGNVGSLFEHNVYTESDGIVFQYNVLMPLLEGAGGNNLKDRSAGTVIRYNWIEGGNRTLDLVESQDGSWDHTGDPNFVYGNVLIKHEDTGQSQVVHFGGDDNSRPDRTLLYFFHNTVYSDRTDDSTLFFVNADATVDVRNNVFFAPDAPLELVDPDDSSEAIVELGNNWLSSGWVVGSTDATVNGAGAQLSGDEPLLSSVPTDFTLLEGSPAIDAGAALASGASGHPVNEEFGGQGQPNARSDEAAPDLGAFAFGSPGVGAGGAGTAGAGGEPGSAGTTASGGGGNSSGGSGGSSTSSGGSGGTTNPSGGSTAGGAGSSSSSDSSDDSGCGCSLPGARTSQGGRLVTLALALGLWSLRRRSRRAFFERR